MSGDWRRMTFAEAVEINPRRPVVVGATVPYVEMAAVQSSGASIEYLLQRQAGGGGAKFRNGDTLFARITPCAENGKTAFVDCLHTNETGMGSTELIVFGPREGLTDPGYVYHLARSEIVRGPAISQMVGTTGRARVPNSVFDEIEVALPPLPEQRRIAEILSSVDEAIAATRAVIEQTRKVKQAVLERLLTKGIGHTRFKQTEIGEIPEGWEVVQLRDLATQITSGSRGWARYYSEEGDLFLRSQNVRSGVLDLSDKQFVKVPKSAEGSRTLVTARDLVFTITGNSVGNVASIPPSLGSAYVSQHVALVRLKDPAISSFLVAFFSPLGPGNQQIMNSQYGQSKPGLSLENIRTLQVPIPSKAELAQLDRIISDYTGYESRLAEELRQLEATKSALMSDLLTGRKRVSDPLTLAAE